MRNPLKAVDTWASQSGDRASLVMWVLVIVMTLMVAIVMLGLYFFTVPSR